MATDPSAEGRWAAERWLRAAAPPAAVERVRSLVRERGWLAGGRYAARRLCEVLTGEEHTLHTAADWWVDVTGEPKGGQLAASSSFRKAFVETVLSA